MSDAQDTRCLKKFVLFFAAFVFVTIFLVPIVKGVLE
jgi:hypothetical protein